MRRSSLVGAVAAAALLVTVAARSTFQTPAIRAVDEAALREYAGVYQWGANAFVYLQLWNEFTGFDKPGQLVAFDESGEIRVLYPTGRDEFFTGSAIAVPTEIESRLGLQRDASGTITSLTRHREGPRTRVRVSDQCVRCRDRGSRNGPRRRATYRRKMHDRAQVVASAGARTVAIRTGWPPVKARTGLLI